MVTDGADTSDASLDEPLASLKARSIPVFTVGVGQEHFAHDIQITRVETPRSALKGTSLVVDVVLSQTGYAGQTVPLNVEDEGRIVSTQDVTLPRRRRIGDRAGELHGERGGRAAVPVPDRAAGRRAGHAEQRARRAGRSRRPRGEGALLRRRAAVRDEVRPPRRRGRQEPRGRHPAAHGREQVLRGSTSATPTSSSAASRRRAKSCSRTARSSSAASKPRRSRPISSGCSPISSASAAADC